MCFHWKCPAWEWLCGWRVCLITSQTMRNSKRQRSSLESDSAAFLDMFPEQERQSSCLPKHALKNGPICILLMLRTETIWQGVRKKGWVFYTRAFFYFYLLDTRAQMVTFQLQTASRHRQPQYCWFRQAWISHTVILMSCIQMMCWGWQQKEHGVCWSLLCKANNGLESGCK